MKNLNWYDNYNDNSDITPELIALAKYIGYRRLPPTIEQFLADPKYLGNTDMGAKYLFPAWVPWLKKLFPTRIHLGYNIATLHCALGTGKSYFTIISELYNECRIDHLDHQRYLRGSTAKELVSSLNHISSDKASSDYLAPINKIKSQSPYFKNNLVSHNRVAHKLGGERNLTKSIGGDVIFYAFSELEFWKYHKAKYALESAIGRITSRIDHARKFFGLIIIDSSPSDTQSSIVNDFLSSYPDMVMNVEMSSWKAREHLNYYFNEGEFFVYTGDQSYDPFILDYPVDQLPVECDKEKVIRVPKELESEFRVNLPRSLKDKAGITSSSYGGKFIKDKVRLDRAFKLPHFNKDIITPDFYDENDRIYDYLIESISKYPLEKKIYGRLDLGLTNDLAGLSFGYFDMYDYPLKNNPKYRVPRYIVPTVVGIGRKPGQETSIDKIAELILTINKDREIAGFSSDSFQSRNLLQKLKLEKINTKLISVDKTNLAYNYLKNCIYTERVSLPASKRLKKELSCLIETNGKIDHIKSKLSTADTDGSFSKDLADAVSGLVFHIYQDLNNADKISNHYSSINSKNIIHGYSEKLGSDKSSLKNKVINDVVRNIF